MSKQTFTALRNLVFGANDSADTSVNGDQPTGENNDDGQGDEQPGDDGQGDDQPSNDGQASGSDGAGAQTPAPKKTPDAAAGSIAVGASDEYYRGVAAANARWATVMLDENCRDNLELATELLADEACMSAGRIISACTTAGRNKGPKMNTATRDDSRPASRLAGTPKSQLGADPGQKDDGGDSSTAAAARQAAVENVNKRRANATGKAGAKKH